MFPTKALELIFRYETLHQPGLWPGGIHGIVIGFDYDLGYVTPQKFVRDWNGLLSPCEIARLLAVVGIHGTAAAEAAPMLRDIEIPIEAAQVVWVLTELTRLEQELTAAFPGVECLPDLARAALVSLIDSRGTRMDGERRGEMREIRDEIEKLRKQSAFGWGTTCRIIAHLIRCMKRLYAPLGGLKTRERRDAEAELLESAAKPENSQQGALIEYRDEAGFVVGYEVITGNRCYRMGCLPGFQDGKGQRIPLEAPPLSSRS